MAKEHCDKQSSCDKKAIKAAFKAKQVGTIYRSEIQQRINQYVYAIDAVFNAPDKTDAGLAGPLANYLSFFTDCVTWIADGQVVATATDPNGKANIAAYLTTAARALLYSQHNLVNPDITITSPCTASVRVHLIQFLQAQIPLTPPIPTNVFANVGRYQLEWVLEDGVWKIKVFIFTTEQGQLGFGPVGPLVIA